MSISFGHQEIAAEASGLKETTSVAGSAEQRFQTRSINGLMTQTKSISKRARAGRATTLPTMTIRAARGSVDSVLWMRPGLIVHDALSGREYRVVRFLGQGGFGAAYQASRLHSTNSSTDTCVLKVTIHAATWHRERSWARRKEGYRWSDPCRTPLRHNSPPSEMIIRACKLSETGQVRIGPCCARGDDNRHF